MTKQLLLFSAILFLSANYASASNKQVCKSTAVKTAHTLFNILGGPNFKAEKSKTTTALTTILEIDPGIYVYKVTVSSKAIAEDDGTTNIVSIPFNIEVGYNGYNTNDKGETKLDKACVVHSFKIL